MKRKNSVNKSLFVLVLVLASRWQEPALSAVSEQPCASDNWWSSCCSSHQGGTHCWFTHPELITAAAAGKLQESPEGSCLTAVESLRRSGLVTVYLHTLFWKQGLFPLSVAVRQFCPCKLVTSEAVTTCPHSSSRPCCTQGSHCSSVSTRNSWQYPATPWKGCFQGFCPLRRHTCKRTSLQSPATRVRADTDVTFSRALWKTEGLTNVTTGTLPALGSRVWAISAQGAGSTPGQPLRPVCALCAPPRRRLLDRSVITTPTRSGLALAFPASGTPWKPLLKITGAPQQCAISPHILHSSCELAKLVL